MLSPTMLHSVRMAPDQRGETDGFCPVPSTMLAMRRRCDRCDHWIAIGTVAIRCPACSRVYHDKCLRGLGCRVTALALRRSRRRGASLYWKCGKCDNAVAAETESATGGPVTQTARDQQQTTETPMFKAALFEPKRLNFETGSINESDVAASPAAPARINVGRAHSKVGLAGDPPADETSEGTGRQSSS